MRVLDFLDSPNLLGSLLGIGSAEAAPGPTPSPTPVPPLGAMGPASEPFSPTSTMGTMATLGGGGAPAGPSAPLSFNDRAQPAQDGVASGVMDPSGMNYTPFTPPVPNGGQMLATRNPGVPIPDAGGLPPPDAGGDRPMQIASNDPGFVPPMRGGPPMPPPGGGAPPTMNTGGGLMAALGLDNQDRQSQFLAGLGKGASAVQGSGGFAAAMRGVGGGITGSQAKATEQVTQKRQAQNDLFNQSSTAFKDMLAADAAGDTSAYKAAQGEYLKARAASLLAGGAAGGSRAWQNTPFGKVMQVEGAVQREQKAAEITMQKQWALNGATPEQQEKDKAALKAATAERRKTLYKMIGMDPGQAEKVMNQGKTKDNAFDTKGMTLQEFNAQVPMGAWYKDQNGVTRQRTKPPAIPGGAGVAPGTAVAPGAADATTNDDVEAMTPAA